MTPRCDHSWLTWWSEYSVIILLTLDNVSRTCVRELSVDCASFRPLVEKTLGSQLMSQWSVVVGAVSLNVYASYSLSQLHTLVLLAV